jgi:hypothetical protein
LIPGKVIVAEMISFFGLGDASGGTDGSVTVVTFVTVDVTFAVVVAGRLPFEIEPVGIRAGKMLNVFNWKKIERNGRLKIGHGV